MKKEGRAPKSPGTKLDNWPAGHPPCPPMAVGVMGSAGGPLDAEVCERVCLLGSGVARRGGVLITGACPGLPH